MYSCATRHATHRRDSTVDSDGGKLAADKRQLYRHTPTRDNQGQTMTSLKETIWREGKKEREREREREKKKKGESGWSIRKRQGGSMGTSYLVTHTSWIQRPTKESNNQEVTSAVGRDQLHAKHWRDTRSPPLYAEESGPGDGMWEYIHTPRLSHVTLTMVFCFLSACWFLSSHLHERLGREIQVRLQGTKLNKTTTTTLKKTI